MDRGRCSTRNVPRQRSLLQRDWPGLRLHVPARLAHKSSISSQISFLLFKEGLEPRSKLEQQRKQVFKADLEPLRYTRPLNHRYIYIYMYITLCYPQGAKMYYKNQLINIHIIPISQQNSKMHPTSPVWSPLKCTLPALHDSICGWRLWNWIAHWSPTCAPNWAGQWRSTAVAESNMAKHHPPHPASPKKKRPERKH